jgi:hypothetical protein
MLRDKLKGMIEVSRLKDEKAGELFLGFRIGAVGRRDFAGFPVPGHGGLRRLKRHPPHNVLARDNRGRLLYADALILHS